MRERGGGGGQHKGGGAGGKRMRGAIERSCCDGREGGGKIRGRGGRNSGLGESVLIL